MTKFEEKLALLAEKNKKKREARKVLLESANARAELKSWTQKRKIASGRPLSKPPEPCESE